MATKETPAYRRCRHAAHYGRTRADGGHDLEEWDCEAPTLHEAYDRYDIPAGAEYHHGYIDRTTRKQHWIFTKIAPLGEGCCERCVP
jgi:hypothetical protein